MCVCVRVCVCVCVCVCIMLFWFDFQIFEIGSHNIAQLASNSWSSSLSFPSAGVTGMRHCVCSEEFTPSNVRTERAR
jgi:hypothetical protein